jgi:hypothetical protein
MSVKTKVAQRAEEAARLYGEAEKLELRRPVDYFERIMNPIEAKRKHQESARLLEVEPDSLVGSAKTEIVSNREPDEPWTAEREHIIDTLSDPNTISVSAAEDRAGAAIRANVLNPALDAVLTAQASNSLEKMLCHQLAAVHMAGMDLLGRAVEKAVDLPLMDRARVAAAAARMFDTYNTGCLTLQKLKTGGKQHVVVQYQQQVNVAPGGKAMVAGRVGRGSRKAGRSRKNGQ